jgi:hypothetical protein
MERTRRTDKLFSAVVSRIKNAVQRRRAKAFLQSDGGQDRPDARSGSSRITLVGASADPLSSLVDDCAKALKSTDLGERDDARAILVPLAMKGHEGAKNALESDLSAAIWDFNLETLVFLAKKAEPRIAAAVDTSLEHNMERLVKGSHLNTLTYMAAESTCSIDAKRLAAAILAKQERRTDNLAYVKEHTKDPEINTLMRAALEDRRR